MAQNWWVLPNQIDFFCEGGQAFLLWKLCYALCSMRYAILLLTGEKRGAL
jgi:hypothetical protein